MYVAYLCGRCRIERRVYHNLAGSREHSAGARSLFPVASQPTDWHKALPPRNLCEKRYVENRSETARMV
jgi:hypothetical protein